MSFRNLLQIAVFVSANLVTLILVSLFGGRNPDQLPSGPYASFSTPTAAHVFVPFVSSSPATVRFAVIGDYGANTQAQADVADLVKSWSPEFIVTTGDNNYPSGADTTIDENVGQYYHEFIGNYSGQYGSGAASNAFYPALGNHDWVASNAQPYLDYFTLPDETSGNERYYDFVRGPVHIFALDSDPHEPDGYSSTSAQASWLQAQLASSTAPWNLIIMHHPPYSSSAIHGSQASAQWPYQSWGATAVLAGHDHTYERIVLDGFPYFVNGLGGRSRYNFGPAIPGSQVRYNEEFGAMYVEANDLQITFSFVARSGLLVDRYSLVRQPVFCQ